MIKIDKMKIRWKKEKKWSRSEIKGSWIVPPKQPLFAPPPPPPPPKKRSKGMEHKNKKKIKRMK